MLPGLSVMDLTHPEDIAADHALLEATVNGQRERYQMDKRYVRPDGETVWVTLTTVLVRDANRKPLHFVSAVEDISERLRYQGSHELSASRRTRASKAKTEFLPRA